MSCSAGKLWVSLSARRAWIEPRLPHRIKRHNKVALRKESVDRNDNGNPVAVSDLESLSARRAWIETRMVLFPALVIMVALRKESVDRNLPIRVVLN